MTEIKEESNPSAPASKRRGVASAVGMGAVLSMLVAENADAATEVAQLAASDNRIGAIATLFVPAVGWVLFNMLQPTLNQVRTLGGFANIDQSVVRRGLPVAPVTNTFPPTCWIPTCAAEQDDGTEGGCVPVCGACQEEVNMLQR